MTRVKDIIKHRNYKTVGDDEPEHLHALKIKRHQFVRWIAEYQLLVGLKLPADLHSYDRVTYRDSNIWIA